MQFYNLNKKWKDDHKNVINLWEKWKQHYIEDLNYKINALMDYLYNFNNNYLIINSESTKEDVIYVPKESTLAKEKNDAISALIRKDGYNNIYYYPYLLEYRQGFINNNRDAKLVFLEQPLTSPIEEPDDEDVIQIPSGYACISIYKPENAQDGVFDKNLSLAEWKSRFVLYPISNGGLYIPKNNGDGTMSFIYHNNMVGKLIDNFNFVWNCPPLRYISVNNWEGGREYIYYSYNEDKIPQIKNIDNLAWTGGEDLTFSFWTSNNEEIFCDCVHEFGEDEKNYMYVNSIKVTTPEVVKIIKEIRFF